MMTGNQGEGQGYTPRSSFKGQGHRRRASLGSVSNIMTPLAASDTLMYGVKEVYSNHSNEGYQGNKIHSNEGYQGNQLRASETSRMTSGGGQSATVTSQEVSVEVPLQAGEWGGEVWSGKI